MAIFLVMNLICGLTTHVAASTCALDPRSHALQNEPNQKLFEDNNKEERQCEGTVGSVEEGNLQTHGFSLKKIATAQPRMAVMQMFKGFYRICIKVYNLAEFQSLEVDLAESLALLEMEFPPSILFQYNDAPTVSHH